MIFRTEVRFVKPSFGFMDDQTLKAIFTAKSDFLDKHFTLNKMNAQTGTFPKISRVSRMF